MGDYKDKNGTTRVGDFLRGAKNIAPSLLEVASTVTGVKGLEKLADKIRGDFSLSKEDKEHALKLLEFDIAEAQEVSKRWNSDMQSDSWLSKNVRPLTLIYLILFTTLNIIVDSIEAINFDVADGYKTLLETVLIVVITAYFGSRGFEKYRKIKNDTK